MKKWISAVALGVGLCIVTSAAVADVYKWKDANGRVHYGDQPTSSAEKVTTGLGNGEAATPEATDDDSKQQKHAEDCNRKRDQLMTYQKASKIVEKDSLGNEKEFNDDDRKKLIDLTQKQIADGCADAPVASQQ